MKDRTFLLVLGAPRSGTTLLTAMIGRHDEVAMLNEDFNGAMRKLVSKRVVGNKLCIPNQIELRQRGRHWQRWLQRRGFFQYRPESALSIEDYLEWSPLKLIAIVRDGASVMSSIQKRGERTHKLAAYRWCRSIEVLYELSERYREQLFLLSFEQLVAEPEQIMQAVAGHLNIGYQPKMLEGYAFTPIYANQGIDASKAAPRSSQEDTQALKIRYPDVYDKYVQLLQRCVGSGRISSHSAQGDEPHVWSPRTSLA